MTPTTVGFPTLAQEFFHRRRLAERGLSTHTIASYRDTFELLLRYAEKRTGRTPSALTLDDLDAPIVLDFLDHLENERGNSAWGLPGSAETAQYPEFRGVAFLDSGGRLRGLVVDQAPPRARSPPRSSAARPSFDSSRAARETAA